VIPLLVLEDGRSLYESGMICEYLDETISGPPLRPEKAHDRATMRNWIRHVDGLIGNLITFNRRHSIARVAAQLIDAELAAKLERIASKERQEAWRRAARRPCTEAEEGQGARQAGGAESRPARRLGRRGSRASTMPHPLPASGDRG
jgi:glutathione S-transferase